MTARNDEWLEAQRRRLLTWDRMSLIEWLQWVDPNGVWTDEDMRREDMAPMSVEDAVEQVLVFVAMNRETPEEMIQAGGDPANVGDYPQPKGARPDRRPSKQDSGSPSVGVKGNPALDPKLARRDNAK